MFLLFEDCRNSSRFREVPACTVPYIHPPVYLISITFEVNREWLYVLKRQWEYSVVLCCAVLYCTVLCCTVLCCAVLYCTVLCCAVLCCAVLCCTVLCCAVLCCTVLYCAVLCCAVLCTSLQHSKLTSCIVVSQTSLTATVWGLVSEQCTDRKVWWLFKETRSVDCFCPVRTEETTVKAWISQFT